MVANNHPPNTFVKYARKVYHPIGFRKGYNFPLFILTVGALFGFCLSRFMYLDIDGIAAKNVIPGEWYYYRRGTERIGLIIHLSGAIPAGLLACFQFVPVIRHKVLIFHRINGYFASTLLIVGNAGALMLARHSVGGDLITQMWFGVFAVVLSGALGNAIWNIKRLQIDQHRAWMIRAWVWAGHIITQRLIMGIAGAVLPAIGYTTYTSIKCAEIFFMYEHVGIPAADNPTSQKYPICGPDARNNTDTYAVVSGSGEGPESAASWLRQAFTMGGILAALIHIFLAELYLWLTPAESYRLRQVSYERQVEKGLRQRGVVKDAGLTSTRIGDAPGWWSLPENEMISYGKVTQDDEDKPSMGVAGRNRSDSEDMGTMDR